METGMFEIDLKVRRKRQEYGLTFGSEMGQRVLVDILTDLGFFDEVVEDTSSLVLQNYARRLLKKCGLLKEARLPDMIGALFNKTRLDE